MLAGAVVPERDRVGRPDKSALVLGHGKLRVQVREQPVAFLAAQPFDVAGKADIHVKPGQPGLRMRAHHRVLHRRKLRVQFFGALAKTPCKYAGDVVHRGQAAHEALHGR